MEFLLLTTLTGNLMEVRAKKENGRVECVELFV